MTEHLPKAVAIKCSSGVLCEAVFVVPAEESRKGSESWVGFQVPLGHLLQEVQENNLMEGEEGWQWED